MSKTIGVLYFFVASTIGLILLIIGLYNGVSLAVNLTQYDKYPTMYPGSDNCASVTMMPSSPPVGVPISPYPVNNDNERKLCEKRVADERKQHRVDDTKNAIYFTMVGITLLAIHLPLGVKRSRDDHKKQA